MELLGLLKLLNAQYVLRKNTTKNITKIGSFVAGQNMNDKLNQKLEDTDEIYKIENYEILMPLRTNNDKIFNLAEFDIKIWREGDKKFVVIRRKVSNPIKR